MLDKVKISLVTNASSLSSLPGVLQEIRVAYGDFLDLGVFPVHEIDEGRLGEEVIFQELRDSCVVLVDIRSNGRSLEIVKEIREEGHKTIIPLLGGSPGVMGLARLGSFSMDKIPARERKKAPGEMEYRKIQKMTALLEKMGKYLPFGAIKHARNWVLAVKYWSNSGRENLKNLLLFVSKEYGGAEVSCLPPQEIPEYGIYHPLWEEYFPSYGDYHARALQGKGGPTVGLLYYGGIHHESSLVGATALTRELEKRGINVLPVVTAGVLNLDPVREIFLAGGEKRVDALVSLVWFRLNGGPLGGDPAETARLLAKLDVPFFTPSTMYSREIYKWRESPTGISPIETLATVTFPELDGAIEPIPVLGLEDLEGSLPLKATAEIPGRAGRIAGRVARRLNLSRVPPGEKKIAFILYNYPPGEDNLGGAAYLDTFASLENILGFLQRQGYRVELPPGGLKEAFLQGGLVNSGKWFSPEVAGREAPGMSLGEYLDFFKEIPGRLQEEMIENWGPPPGEVMTWQDRFIFPGIQLGNAFVGIQPSRGIHEVPGKAYHDQSLPPHHQYLAFYRYLEKGFGADALVHVGTHGTLEFLPGKEVGLSGECYPDILLGEVPHFYLYHVTNPSEAMIAKRRGYGTLVNYPSPPFTTSSLYGQFLHLEDLLGEYREMQLAGDQARARQVRESIGEVVEELGLDPGEPEELHRELSLMKKAVIPQGLHIFGQEFSPQERVSLLAYMSRLERGSTPSLLRLLGDARGASCPLGPEGEGTGPNGELEEKIMQFWQEVAPDLGEGPISPDRRREVRDKYSLEQASLDQVLDYYQGVYRDIYQSDGLQSLLGALQGRFTRPNLSGDPLRTPEVFPTGSNSYQFDPRLIPTDIAYARGKEIAGNTLQAFYQENGRYPRAVGVVLWGFETAKTRGETVGQILAYLGLRLVHGRGWYPEVEVVPLEQLGRPRIDVNVNICGFFRDLFPNLVKILDDSFRLVARLEEPEDQNYVKGNTAEVFRGLLGGGEEEALARKLAGSRLFGPRPGEYGTNLTSLIETSAWEKEKELSDSYRDNMGHVYGLNIQGEKAEKVFQDLLSRTELVSQVRDTNEYEISDLDHYYEFFGGLSAAVGQCSGRKPRLLISDTTGERVVTDSASRALKRGINTRLLNPRWIRGLLKHNYHGAQKVSDRVENLIGFAATVGVESKTFSRVAQQLLFDRETFQALKDNNPFAAGEVAHRLREAVNRGYWQATEEEMEQLKEVFMEIEGDLEEIAEQISG